MWPPPYFGGYRLAARAEPPAQPGEVQANITYVVTKEEWLYVAGVLDKCNSKIVGWAAALNYTTINPVT